MYKLFKRVFDVTSSLILAIVISPILILISIVVRLNLGSPIIFTQVRSGKNMIPFKLFKFRTMTDATDSNGNLLPDHQRVTKFGKWLRSSSLDELPELFNIMKGDMSVIGPRPLPLAYNKYYTEYEQKRFKVRGGLITPDSVDSNPIITWDEQLNYEANYADNLSLKNDLKIILGVFKILIKRQKTDYGSYERDALDKERSSASLK
jgi:lipopolysaccharide/colanic/teichoic acid biosynthesis glycosyltransferase